MCRAHMLSDEKCCQPLCRHFGLRCSFLAEHHCQAKKPGVTVRDPLLSPGRPHCAFFSAIWSRSVCDNSDISFAEKVEAPRKETPSVRAKSLEERVLRRSPHGAHWQEVPAASDEEVTKLAWEMTAAMSRRRQSQLPSAGHEGRHCANQSAARL